MPASAALTGQPPALGTAEGGDVLIVRHGPDRGRETSFLPLLLLRTERTRPGLMKHVRVHDTGTPPPQLDGIGSILFFLGDPLELYPHCQAEALALSANARARGIRLINPPESLNNTTKSRQSQLWRRAGIPCAAAEPAADEEALRALLPRLQFPVILRFDHGHTQKGMFLCHDEADALRRFPLLRFPVVALEYVDTRESWKRTEPGSVMAQYFHKKRSMVLVDRVLNNHVFFSNEPVVGSSSSTFQAASEGEPVDRLDEMLAADIGYSMTRAERPDLMKAAVRALGLDIAAIDYSTFADGRVVLWEANPYFALPHWSQALFNGPRRLDARNPRYVEAMLREIVRLTGYVDE